MDPADILAAAEADEPVVETRPGYVVPTIDTDRPYVTAYTDGSSTGGWGPGGWGWCVIDGPSAGREASEGCGWTTNQREELKAAHAAMLAIPGLLLIASDSEYVVKGFTEWARGWWAKDFRKVSNTDLWRPAIQTYLDRGGPTGEVRFTWVKGHADLPGNERADVLSRKAREAVPFADWGPRHDPVAYAAYTTPGGRSTIGKALR